MNEHLFRQFVNEFVEELRALAPRDKGTLADYGITFHFEGVDRAVIEVDLDKAPYMPFTNEPWISPKWKGRKNPNEAWWQRRIDEIVRKLVRKYKGELKIE